MAYQVDRFNGTFLTSVDDGTIDTTTDLRLVGKNYAGYGEIQNENFLHLLENFSNSTSPPKPISGQIWYDSGNKKLKFYDGNKFKVASGAEIGSAAPAGLGVGEFWYDTSANQLYIWNGEEFVLVGPESSLELGASAAVSAVIKDILGNNHVVLKLISAGETIGLVSKDEFKIGNETPVTGFYTVKKGITLIETDNDPELEETGISSGNHYFWGTSSNTLKLGGLAASEYLKRGSVAFNEDVSFSDSGFVVGDQSDLAVFIKENGSDPVLETRNDRPLTIRIKSPTSVNRDVALFTLSSVEPGETNTYDLGSVNKKWKDAYANTFYGNLVGDVEGVISGEYKGNIFANDDSLAYDADNKIFYGAIITTPANEESIIYGNLIGDLTGTASNSQFLNNLTTSEAATPLTIPVRDVSGNLIATRFIGTIDKSDRLKIDNSATDTDLDYRSAKTTATPDTIAARDELGNLNAIVFSGTATSARYADLAEKYLSDQDYPAGTVVMVGGEKEVTAAQSNKKAIGVVSKNPAFMMNKDLEGGIYIALKGRVPVLVKGKVSKGDGLVVYDQGIAISEATHSNLVFAISLESSDNDETKIIEAVIL